MNKFFKPILLFISITFLSCMITKNAAAVDFTVPLKPVSNGSVTWTAQYNTLKTAAGWETINLPAEIPSGNNSETSTRWVGAIYTRQNVNIKKDNYYEVKLAFLSNSLEQFPLGILWTLQNSQNFRIIDIKESLKQIDPSYIPVPSPESPFNLEITPVYNGQYVLYTITLQALRTTSAPLMIGNTNSISVQLMPHYGENQLNMIIAPIGTYAEFEPSPESKADEVAEKELEDRDNIESQSSTTENQADNASNAAETTGTTLFGAFTQLLTALTNVNGNSCTLPNMQVYSLNLGSMNLCTYAIPSQISALVSIGMVFIIVPLGIHLVKRMLSLYKEITG